MQFYFQALFAMGPFYMWKTYENRRMKSLTSNMLFCNFSDRDRKCAELIKHFKLYEGKNSFYLLSFLFCEMLSILLILTDIYTTKLMFGNSILTFGYDFAFYIVKGGKDPRLRIFPKIAKCIFKHHAGSGQIETNDFICLFPKNALSEKIYLVLWLYVAISLFFFMIFWFILNVLYLSPEFRGWASSIGTHLPAWQMIQLCKKVKHSDFFLIDLIGQNVDSLLFSEFIKQLLDSKKHSTA